MTDGSKRIAFLVAGEGIEQAELVEPWQAVSDAGHEPVLLSLEQGKVQLFDHLTATDTRPVNLAVADAKVQDYAALVLPGGVANPDALRTDPDAVSFVRDFVASGKPVAAICHAPWTLIEADVVAAAGSPPGPACRRICATPARTGWTRRSSPTAT